MTNYSMHIMFDIDGTLVQSCDFDSFYFEEAVRDVTGLELYSDRSRYLHVSDEGILRQHFKEAKLDHLDEAIKEVKHRFIRKIEAYLQYTSANEIFNAAKTIKYLMNNDEISLSLATGGWKESALLKLASAGIDIEGIEIGSSNDHYDRTKIMLTAKTRAGVINDDAITYVGDGLWDLHACQKLGWNFILIGNKTKHHQQIDDYSELENFLCLCSFH